MKTHVVVAAAALGLGMSSHASAQFFVGAAAGSSEWPTDVCANASSCDRRNSTWMTRAGYMFLPWIGIEARYVDLGRTTVQYGTPNVFESRYEVRGPGVGAVFAVPVAGGLAVTAVGGVARLRTSLEIPEVTTQSVDSSVTLAGFSGSTTKSKPYVGVGVDYLVGPRLSVGLDATRYRLDGGGDIDTLTAGLTYRFR